MSTRRMLVCFGMGLIIGAAAWATVIDTIIDSAYERAAQRPIQQQHYLLCNRDTCIVLSEEQYRTLWGPKEQDR